MQAITNQGPGAAEVEAGRKKEVREDSAYCPPWGSSSLPTTGSFMFLPSPVTQAHKSPLYTHSNTVANLSLRKLLESCLPKGPGPALLEACSLTQTAEEEEYRLS